MSGMYLIAAGFDDEGCEANDVELGPYKEICFREFGGTNNVLIGIDFSGSEVELGYEHRGLWVGGLLEEETHSETSEFRIVCR